MCCNQITQQPSRGVEDRCGTHIGLLCLRATCEATAQTATRMCTPAAETGNCCRYSWYVHAAEVNPRHPVVLAKTLLPYEDLVAACLVLRYTQA